MACWTRSSARRAHLVLALAAAVLASGGCRHAPPATPAGGAASLDGAAPRKLLRIALLPLYNLTSGAPPLAQLRSAVETEVARQGFEVVSGEPVAQFLARHRIRHTGGISAGDARRAHEDLDVDAVLISTVTLYAAEPVPALGLQLRLVSASEEASVLWIAENARSGSDSPGLLNLGIVTDPSALRRMTLEPIMASLRDFRRDLAPCALPCEGARRFGPKLVFRSPEARIVERSRFAVLPFLDDSRRRDAGEVVNLALVHQLAAVGAVQVIEPGVLREVLLDQRVIIESGVTLDVARQVLGALDADYVLAGRVYDYAEAGGSGVPQLNFSTVLLEARTGQIVWQSTSYSRGDDGVFFFGLGTVRNGPDLACQMAWRVVERMVGKVAPQAAPDAGERFPRARRRDAAASPHP